MRSFDAKREQIAEANPKALFADGLESALVGYTVNDLEPSRAVYCVDRCIDAVMRQGADYDEAVEHLEHNIVASYVGKHGPLYVKFFRRRRA